VRFGVVLTLYAWLLAESGKAPRTGAGYIPVPVALTSISPTIGSGNSTVSTLVAPAPSIPVATAPPEKVNSVKSIGS